MTLHEKHSNIDSSGGRKLYIKSIASFNTMSVVNIFHLRNDNTPEMILAEFVRILSEAKDIAEIEDMEGSMQYSWKEIPAMNVRKLMPKIVGQDTKMFQGWSGRQHEMRKTITIEADEDEVEMIQYWVEIAKNRRIFQKFWGHKVKVTAVLDNWRKWKGTHQTQQKVDMAAVASYSRKHINYMNCTRMDGIRGVLNLDKQVTFYSATEPSKAVGTLSLRWLLYQEVKMEDGYNLFEEIHQGAAMGAVDVAIPNCEEAERLMLMIQRNAAAFFTYYLRSKSELPPELIAEVISKSMDPILVNEIERCQWDEKAMTLTTPEDVENDKMKKMEEAAWYNDVFGDNIFDLRKQEKRTFANKEALQELHCDHSYKSIHKKKGNYVGSPGVESFQVGQKLCEMDVDTMEDGEDSYANLSPAELIAMLKKHNISPRGTVGSPPNVERFGSGRDAEAEESDSSSSGSSSGSDSSSFESVTLITTSPPSAGGVIARRTPGHGE